MTEWHHLVEASAPVANGGGVIALLLQNGGHRFYDFRSSFDLCFPRIHMAEAVSVGVLCAVQARIGLKRGGDGREAMSENLRACGEGIDGGRNASGCDAIGALRTIAGKAQAVTAE